MTMICKICSNANNNKLLLAEEKMFGLQDKFEYFECSECGCLQIKKVPENISSYYPPDYYSFSDNNSKKTKRSLHSILKNLRIRSYLNYQLGNKINLLGYLYSLKYSRYSWLNSKVCSLESKILDIGCGSGNLIKDMSLHGFKNLKGIDPYITDNIYINENAYVEKKEIFELEEIFDFIMMHHSFEHMINPEEILKKSYSILNKDRYLLIRIPLATYAYKKYGLNWYQLDAPRHFFLHTIKSINILAEKTGFEVKSILFDSDKSQFEISEKYQRGYTLKDPIKVCNKQQLKEFSILTKKLNDSQEGDQACFYLYKK